MTTGPATLTWSFGNATSAVQFTVQFNTATSMWTVNMQRGSMDLNALWWSNEDSIKNGQITLAGKDNSLNMNGTNIIWDGYDKLSDTGIQQDGWYLTEGTIRTFAITAETGSAVFNPYTFNTLGVRATSINGGSDGIKAVGRLPVINYAPTAVNDSGAATEAGGVNNGSGGSNATGNVLTNDAAGAITGSPVVDTKTVTSVRTGANEGSGTAGTVGSELQGQYGKLTLNANGTYSYCIDNNNLTVQALTAGSTLNESFNYTMVDNIGQSDSAVLAITITGANDNATITVNGTPDTAVSEAGGLANGSPGDSSASGDLDLSDVDGGEALFQTPLSLAGTYGDFTFNASSGGWGYTLNDADSDTQALTAGQTTTDSLLVTSFDGTASQVITVNITGANDSPAAVADQWTLSDTALPAGIITPNWFLWNDTDAESQGTLYVTDVTGLSGTGLTAIYDSANQNRLIGFTGTPTTPAGGASQTDYTLGYSLHDGQGGSALGTVNLRVQATTASANTITIDQTGNDYSYIDLQDGADFITGANDTVAGSAGIDYIVGGQAADSIFGEGGNDTIDGGAGIDTLSGGDDDDTFNVVNATDSASDTIDGGSGTQDKIVISTGTAFSLGTDAQVVNVEIIEATGTSGVSAANQTENLTILGSATSNAALTGGSGDDTITKTVSSATTGGTSFGGFGNDTITWTVATGVSLNNASNWLRGGAGNDTITINLNGGAFTNMAIAGNSSTTATQAAYNSFNPANTFTDDDTVILNGSLGSTVTNSRAALNSGNDIFISNLTAGTIAVHGGAGNDTLIGGAGADNSALQGMIGTAGLVGGDGDDMLVGRDGADILDGDGGNDTLDADIDTVDYSQDGGTGAVIVNLATGTATDSWGSTDSLKSIENVIGTSLADTITGSAVANVLSGGIGDDNILGEAGNDTLVGGMGADNLTGGIGINVFLYNATNEGNDLITDFASGSDKLSFSSSAFGSITSATLDSNFFIRADSIAQNDVTPQFIFNTATRALIYDANGTNPAGQITLLTVQSGASIVANDLVFI
jgi:VCBS repeat-containing protein